MTVSINIDIHIHHHDKEEPVVSVGGEPLENIKDPSPEQLKRDSIPINHDLIMTKGDIPEPEQPPAQTPTDAQVATARLVSDPLMETHRKMRETVVAPDYTGVPLVAD